MEFVISYEFTREQLTVHACLVTVLARILELVEWNFLVCIVKKSFNLSAAESAQTSLRVEFLFLHNCLLRRTGGLLRGLLAHSKFGWCSFSCIQCEINHRRGEIIVLQKVGKIQNIRTKQNFLRQMKGKVS